MSIAIQTSLFDGAPEVALGSLSGGLVRQELGRGAWVDVLPGWMTGADALFDALLSTVHWTEERRQMYERVVLVPRLLRFYGEDEVLPDAALTQARDALNAHYEPELGEPFRTAGMRLYRDGRDSAAWHGDTIGRGKSTDTIVAILCGFSRAQLPASWLRRWWRHYQASGRPWRPARDGGGSCQRTWGACRAEDGSARGPADQHPVPAPWGPLGALCVRGARLDGPAAAGREGR